MVLDAKRDKAERFLMPAAKALRKVDPNVISLMALILAFLTGVSAYYSYHYWKLLLPTTAVLVIASGYLDAVDGKVARISGKANKRGDFIDHVFDRYADIFMIGGVALSGWCDIYLGILALLGVLMTSYMGTQAQALGIGRMYAGLLGRADRIVLMFFVPIFQLLFTAITGDRTFSLLGYEMSIFELMMAWFAVIGNITAVQRAIYTWRELGDR